MKYDEAYCTLFEDKLTIYEVRDLNFDETSTYDSDNSLFLCPDDLCREAIGKNAKLAIVNAKKRRYIKTPHFKDTPSTLHRKHCPYGNMSHLIVTNDPELTHIEGVKEHHFPTEFIPKRKVYVKNTQKLTSDDDVGVDGVASKSRPPSDVIRGKSTNRTSVLEHIVECYMSNRNDKSVLLSMPLTIEELKLNYWSFFKAIKYFRDRKGLIYWGKVKTIKDYQFSFRVDFWDQVDEKLVCLYIKKDVIDSYRKKMIFLEEIREAIQKKNDKYCFFYGIYPVLQKVTYGDNEFEVYNAEIINIDHVLIRAMIP